MYRTVIVLKDIISDSALSSITKTINNAFVNLVGKLKNNSTDKRTFIFAGDYPCVEVCTFTLRHTEDFISHIKTWDWIDENQDENCNMLDVFSRHR